MHHVLTVILLVYMYVTLWLLHIIAYDSCPSELVGVLCQHPHVHPGIWLSIFHWREGCRYINQFSRHLSNVMLIFSSYFSNIINFRAFWVKTHFRILWSEVEDIVSKNKIFRLWSPSEELVLQKGFYTYKVKNSRRVCFGLTSQLNSTQVPHARSWTI